jgi:hypothetical protein
VLEDVRAQRLLSGRFRRGGLPAMEIAALAEVRREAPATPPLVPVAKAIEELEWQDVAAAPAASDTARSPNGEAADRQRVARPRHACAPVRDGTDATNPDAHRRLRDAELARDASQRPPELRPKPAGFFTFSILALHEHMFAIVPDGSPV